MVRWNGSNSSGDSSPTSISNQQTALDLAEMLQIIQTSSHSPQRFSTKNWQSDSNNEIQEETVPSSLKSHETCNWRQFLSDFNLLEKSKEVPANFYRDIRHLDSSMSREVHKVAVIFVGKDQEVSLIKKNLVTFYFILHFFRKNNQSYLIVTVLILLIHLLVV